MNQYQINGLAEDLEQKLSLYSQRTTPLKKVNSLNDPRYEIYAEIIINKNNLPFEYMLNRLENYFKSGIEIKEDKVAFHYSEYSQIGSYVYKKLFELYKEKAFEKYLKILTNNIYGEIYNWLNIEFDFPMIRDNYLDSATQYITENQNQEWEKEFKEIDYKRYNWFQRVENIPHKFESNEDLYFWLKNTRSDETLMIMGNPLVKYLLHQVIKYETYNTYIVNEKNRILQILDTCKNDYITIGEILTNKEIKLNCYFLKSNQYSLFGFCNLYNQEHLILRNNNDIKIFEILSKQLVDIYFHHFYNFYYKNDYSHRVFHLLNYITNNFVQQNNNTRWTYANYIFKLILKKLIAFEVSKTTYQKEIIFNYLIKDLINKQLEKFKNDKDFNKKNYFLLSFYLKEAIQEQKLNNLDYSDLIEKLSTSVLNNLEIVFSDLSDNNKTYIDFDFLDKIEYGLFYTHSTNKKKWLKIFNIKECKKELNSSDIYVPLTLSQYYLKILIQVFTQTKDKQIANHINKIIIELGFNVQYTIFDSLNDQKVYFHYLEILNLFQDNLFQEFLENLTKNKKLKMMLQLLANTISDTRKKQIEQKTECVVQNIELNDLSYHDLKEGIAYAIENDFLELSTSLANIYNNKQLNKSKNPYLQSIKRDFNEIICKKELIDILENKELDVDTKFTKLNNYKVNTENCESFKEHIRALIFFNNKEYLKSYNILRILCEKNLNSTYLMNMISSYFNAYEKDNNKKEKYQNILNKYEEDLKRLQPYTKTLFEYQTLLYGYIESENTKQVLYLLKEMPKQFEYDFSIFQYKYQFLRQNQQELKAKEYIQEFKNFYKSNQDILTKIKKIEQDLDSNIRMEVENKLDVKILFDSTYLSIEEAEKYWNKIQNMNTQVHSQVFAQKDTIEEFVVEIMIQLSSELLERRENIIRNEKNKNTLELEDIINDWVGSLLSQRMNYLSWNIKDQSRGSSSGTNEGVGERDLLAYDKYKNKIFLFEAFRLFSCDTTKIEEHIDKLDGYNADGTKLMIIMSYTYVNDFTKLCSNYEKFLKTFNYKGFDQL